MTKLKKTKTSINKASKKENEPVRESEGLQERKVRWATLSFLIGFLGLISLGGAMLIDLDDSSFLTTSLSGRVKSKEAQFKRLKKCKDELDRLQANTCNMFLLEKPNVPACNNVKVTAPFILGEKNCCSVSLEHTKLCLGDNIFFENSNVESSYVLNAGKCNESNPDRLCEYYPEDGYHFKTDSNGEIIYEDGKPIVERDCEEKKIRGQCSNPCGGGIAIVQVTTKDCKTFSVEESCNEHKCSDGWKEN